MRFNTLYFLVTLTSAALSFSAPIFIELGVALDINANLDTDETLLRRRTFVVSLDLNLGLVSPDDDDFQVLPIVDDSLPLRLKPPSECQDIQCSFTGVTTSLTSLVTQLTHSTSEVFYIVADSTPTMSETKVMFTTAISNIKDLTDMALTITLATAYSVVLTVNDIAQGILGVFTTNAPFTCDEAGLQRRFLFDFWWFQCCLEGCLQP